MNKQTDPDGRAPGGTSAPQGAFASTASRRSVLLRLLGLCWRERARCIQVILCQIALLTLSLAGLGSTGLGIDYLRSILQPHAPPVHWPFALSPPPAWGPQTVIAVIAAVVIAAALLRGTLAWLSGALLARLVHRRVISDLQTTVFAKLQHLNFRFFDQHSRGEIINRATGDIQAVRTFVDTVLIQALVTVLTVAVYVSYMASIHVGLTFACLATLPLLWIACVMFSHAVHPLYLRNRELFDRMVLTLAESIEGVGVIKGFAREREMGRRFREHNLAVKDQQGRIFWRTSLFTPGIDLLTQVNLVVLLIYGGKLVIEGVLPLGTGLVVFAGLLQQFSTQVTTIAQIANGVQESLTGARRVFDILDAPAGLPMPPNPIVPPVSLGAVRFENVSFSHKEGGPAALQNIDFAVAPGECIAIVGETGSGKSALLSLIPRFYDPTSGRVFVDEYDVRTLDLQTLRRRVGVVFQESFLFSDTVAANIAFGQPDASHEAIVAAARAACAHDFITALPDGYDTVLGESGVDLSGGQRQRLTIARALLTNPSILVLDDPTAAIDPETEHEILIAIEQALAGRTTFVVAHRLSTLQRANRIIVLERGRIVQTGTHAGLMREDGPYRGAALHQMIDEESRRMLAEEIVPLREEHPFAAVASEEGSTVPS
ncbi:MAG TPA: ABC transporter ATP-binding protein [Opitutaceae bacterium]|nr:ABC transporter ATP-binding protein [Opitutaceae bacterium]